MYTVGGLPYPEADSEHNPLDYSAVQLFVGCAKRVQTHLTIDDLAEVAHLCRLLYGMPLAIELAAAWVGTLSVAEITEEIRHNLDFLQTDLRDVPERLRSIRAVFVASWERLTREEQIVFSKLSVFQGGCTREAAKAVADADVIMLSRLVNKALLWRTAGGRYEIHELLRQYAEQQLEATGQAETTRQAHATHFAQFASRWGLALKGQEQIEGLSIIEADIDNIRRGWQTASDAKDAELLALYADMWLFLDIRGWYNELLKIYEYAIQQLGYAENAAVGKLMANRSLALSRIGRFSEAAEAARMSTYILQDCGLQTEALVPMMIQGDVISDLERRDSFYFEAHELATRCGDRWAIATTLFLLGYNNVFQKKIDLGKKMMTQAYIEMKNLGNLWGMDYTSGELAYLAYTRQDYEEAFQLYQERLINAQKINHTIMIGDSLAGLSRVAWKQGKLPEALKLHEDAIKIYKDIGVNPAPSLTTLGLIVNEMGNSSRAMSYFRQAFDSLKQSEMIDDLLYLALVIAECLTPSGAKESAVELLSAYQQHPQQELMSVILLDIERPNRLIEQLKADMSSEAFIAAWELGSASTLEATLEKILY